MLCSSVSAKCGSCSICAKGYMWVRRAFIAATENSPDNEWRCNWDTDNGRDKTTNTRFKQWNWNSLHKLKRQDQSQQLLTAKLRGRLHTCAHWEPRRQGSPFGTDEHCHAHLITGMQPQDKSKRAGGHHTLYTVPGLLCFKKTNMLKPKTVAEVTCAILSMKNPSAGLHRQTVAAFQSVVKQFYSLDTDLSMHLEECVHAIIHMERVLIEHYL